MLLEEELKSIDELIMLKHFLETEEKYEGQEREVNAIKIVLNLINKLQKENEEKDKQIDLSAEFIKKNMSEKKIINEICIKGKCNNEECHEDDLKECIKQYFEKLVKEKKIKYEQEKR